MNGESTNKILNRLLKLHYRSLAMYLSYAAPSWHRGEERAQQTLQLLVADQQSFVERINEMILENGGVLDYGEFPLVFTGYHDLSFDFLLTKLIENQRASIAAIEQCVTQLSSSPLAQALAEEALGAAKGHLESLEELQRPATAASSS